MLRRLADRATDRMDATEMRFLGGAALVLGDFPSSSAHLARRCCGVPRRRPARAARADPRDPLLGQALHRRLGPGPRRSGGVEPAGGRDGRAVLGDHRDGRQGHARRAARRQRVGRADRGRGAGQSAPGRRPVHPRRHAAHPRRRGPAGGPSRRGVRSPDPDVRSDRRHAPPEHVDMGARGSRRRRPRRRACRCGALGVGGRRAARGPAALPDARDRRSLRPRRPR